MNAKHMLMFHFYDFISQVLYVEQYKRQNTKRDAQSALFGAPSVRIHGFKMASNIRWLIKVLLSGNQLVLPQTSANLTHEEQLAICLLGIVANGAVSSEQAYNAIFEASLS
ncbi:hypothetical protein CUMW_270690 [Citrus unshiu]|uniref:Uncharacterized protein n=1 Tax=Citrus unshiu TaxID=55188 RepID=A0A2H5QXD2_CITUN|nr:hypothetical protein CUMW_270690 [Citrus unshiu]